MDPSERLSVLVALTHLFQEDQLSCDVLVSAFAAAVRCGRRATGELKFLHKPILVLHSLAPIPEPEQFTRLAVVIGLAFL
jgi:hypothetical protein